jgi:hypothetical protein
MGQMFMYDLYQVSFEGNAVTQKYFVSCGTIYSVQMLQLCRQYLCSVFWSFQI